MNLTQKDQNKINEIVRDYPINCGWIPDEELSAYKQGLRCGATEMANYKNLQQIDDARIYFIKTCFFLNRNGLINEFDWEVKAKEFKEYIQNQILKTEAI